VDGMRPIHEVGSEENACKYHRAKGYVSRHYLSYSFIFL
jgi:hypothetical protein